MTSLQQTDPEDVFCKKWNLILLKFKVKPKYCVKSIGPLTFEKIIQTSYDFQITYFFTKQTYPV